MSNQEQEGGKPIEPLEPGRPDVMPHPSPEDTGQQPVDDDEELSSEEDMSDVDVNNSVAEETPPQR